MTEAVQGGGNCRRHVLEQAGRNGIRCAVEHLALDRSTGVLLTSSSCSASLWSPRGPHFRLPAPSRTPSSCLNYFASSWTRSPSFMEKKKKAETVFITFSTHRVRLTCPLCLLPVLLHGSNEIWCRIALGKLSILEVHFRREINRHQNCNHAGWSSQHAHFVYLPWSFYPFCT